MLNHENISFRIFEYHEGILDASQKAELMKYLHQNPELNHDFAIWAQVRLHDEHVEKPVFAKKLLKKDPIYFPWAGIVRLTGEMAILCAIFFLWNLTTTINANENKRENRKMLGKEASSITKPIGSNNKKLIKKIEGKYEFTGKIISETTSDFNTHIVREDSSKEILIPEYISTLSVQGSNPDIIEYEPVLKEPMITILKPEKEKPAIKRRYLKKHYAKQKFSLRPTSKIVPQNPGF